MFNIIIIRGWKLKPQWDITTNLLEYLTNKTDNTKCCWGCETIRTLIHCWRIQISTATLEKSLVVSYKAKNTLTIWLSSLALKNLPKLVENLCSQKKLYVSEWVNKQWYISLMECYLAIKKNEQKHGWILNAFC